MSSVQVTMLEKLRSGNGFIAALDQSGGSTQALQIVARGRRIQ